MIPKGANSMLSQMPGRAGHECMPNAHSRAVRKRHEPAGIVRANENGADLSGILSRRKANLFFDHPVTLQPDI